MNIIAIIIVTIIMPFIQHTMCIRHFTLYSLSLILATTLQSSDYHSDFADRETEVHVVYLLKVTVVAGLEVEFHSS